MPASTPRIPFWSGTAIAVCLALARPAFAQTNETPHRLLHHVLHPAARPRPTHGHARPAMHAPQRLLHHAPARPIPVPVPIPAPAPSAPPEAPPKGSSTGLPLPRFASLRADAVNLRGGPGTRYPIQWVYRRRDLPVEIEREFDVWRLVEDSDGVKGWVHQATLVGTRTFIIPGAGAGTGVGDATRIGALPSDSVVGRIDPSSTTLPPGAKALRAAPQSDAALVAVLEPGIVGRIRACPAGSGWCRVSVRDYSGWLPRDSFWGLLPGETITP